jgi:hypothetical protein
MRSPFFQSPRYLPSAGYLMVACSAFSMRSATSLGSVLSAAVLAAQALHVVLDEAVELRDALLPERRLHELERLGVERGVVALRHGGATGGHRDRRGEDDDLRVFHVGLSA